jgi:hypothetical protein
MKHELNPVLHFWRVEGGELGGPTATVGFDPSGTKVWSCEGCERGWEKSDLDTVRVHAEGKGAKFWPNFLFGFKLIISAKVLDDLRANGITGYVPHKVRFHKIDSPKLQKIEPPDYFLIEVTGRIDVERKWFDGGEGFVCPVCKDWQKKPGGKYGLGAKILMPILDSWDGSDFVEVRNVGYGSRYCTTRVLELARSKKWFNASFSAITPRPFQVNLDSENWFAEIEGKVQAEYPQLFAEGE